MLTSFLNQNIHFAVNIIAAMVVSWCFWLFLDAYSVTKSIKELLKFLGFFLLTLAFLVHSFSIETSAIEPFINEGLYQTLLLSTKFGGYLLILLGHLIDPILPKPMGDKVSKVSKVGAMGILGGLASLEITGIPFNVLMSLFFPVMAAGVGLVFLYKATIGLEYHLRRVAFAFFGLSLFELISLREIFVDTTNIGVFRAVGAFGGIWWIEHLILLVASLGLGKWVFSYLLKRLQTQLYIFFSISVLIIFIISTVSFTGFLLSNIQSETLSQLQTNVKVLNYALNIKKQALASDAQVFAEGDKLISALAEDQKTEISKLASNYLLQKSLSFLVVVDSDGQVIARGEEPERVGDALSGNPLIARSLAQKPVSSIAVRDGVLAPEVFVSSTYPVISDDEVVGSVYLGSLIDNAFVDGLKAETGFLSSIYGGSKISATTFLAEDSLTRRIGISESSQDIITKVLGKGEAYAGETTFLNTPYVSAYLPLKDIDDAPIGMLYVGRPQISVLATAGRSMQGSYVVAGLLWLLAILPSYLIAGYIAKQLK